MIFLRTAVRSAPIALSCFFVSLISDARADWSDWIAAEAKAGRAVWAYFNNDPEAHAIHDAQNLRAMIRQILR